VDSGDGSTGSVVSFEREPKVEDHIRRAGEEIVGADTEPDSNAAESKEASDPGPR